ncbi:MAG: NAD(P)/FAD-dependent oxidoreductase [Eubacteriales bacterium]|nr:NAD(P)/FAD-dependent oxidoreductase [Eubacteriales bacterium]
MGGGPAGLIAAGRAAECGAPVILLEKNEQPGRKLLITGAGRCNVTTQDDVDDTIARFFGQGRFLYPALSHFYRPELLDLLSHYGTPCVVDHQGKYFPVSNQANDVLQALLRYVHQQGVQIRLNHRVHAIKTIQSYPDSPTQFVVSTSQGDLSAQAVILATGGMTYQSTGSTGDGYLLAESLMHPINRVRPALVPFLIRESYVHELSGLSLQDVQVTLHQIEQKSISQRGDLLLTHKGVSGPVILRLSRELHREGTLEINLLPSYTHEALITELLRLFAQNPRQQLKNALDSLVPHRLVVPLLKSTGFETDMQTAQAGRELAGRLATALQRWTLTVTGQAGQHLAMVTAGGVSLKSIQPSTLASKRVPGLFIAGEVLDLDGDTGGYNLQAAFSTGWLAGESAATYWQAHH